MQTNKEEFIKADNGKLEWDLMPFEQLEPVVRILMFGKNKYKKDNWKKCDDATRYQNAAMRHLVSYMKGEKQDPESGESHLAHLICNALFLMYFDKQEEVVKEAAKHIELKSIAPVESLSPEVLEKYLKDNGYVKKPVMRE